MTKRDPDVWADDHKRGLASGTTRESSTAGIFDKAGRPVCLACMTRGDLNALAADKVTAIDGNHARDVWCEVCHLNLDDVMCKLATRNA